MSEEQLLQFGDVTPIEALGLKYTSDRGRKRRGTFLFECSETGLEWTVWTKGSKTHAWKINCPGHNVLGEGQWLWDEVVDAIAFSHRCIMRKYRWFVDKVGARNGQKSVYIAGTRTALQPFVEKIAEEFTDRVSFIKRYGEITDMASFVRRIKEPVRDGRYGDNEYGIVLTGPGSSGMASFIRATEPEARVSHGSLELYVNGEFEVSLVHSRS